MQRSPGAAPAAGKFDQAPESFMFRNFWRCGALDGNACTLNAPHFQGPVHSSGTNDRFDGAKVGKMSERRRCHVRRPLDKMNTHG